MTEPRQSDSRQEWRLATVALVRAASVADLLHASAICENAAARTDNMAWVRAADFLRHEARQREDGRMGITP